MDLLINGVEDTKVNVKLSDNAVKDNTGTT